MEVSNLALSNDFPCMSKVSKLRNFEQTVVELDTLPNLQKNQMQAYHLQRETTSLESQQGHISLQKCCCPMKLLSFLNYLKRCGMLKKPLTKN